MAIKVTPLLNPLDSNKLLWRFNPNRIYSVCTAYHHIMDNILENDHLKENGN